jgi:HAD superfamily hydrolase (TIGR01509 family)
MFTVLWDNDGVLVDTEGRYFQATRTVLGTVGIELSVEQFQAISLRQGESAFLLAEERGIEAERIAGLRAERDRIYVKSLEAGSCVIDRVEEVLQSLHGKVRMAVVTTSRREPFEIVHANSGLLGYFDFVLTREDYEHSKPHPEPYLTAMGRYGVRPDQCVVVEDSERGLGAATAAGVDCIIVLNEWTRNGTFDDALAVVEGIADVPEVILSRMAAG